MRSFLLLLSLSTHALALRFDGDEEQLAAGSRINDEDVNCSRARSFLEAGHAVFRNTARAVSTMGTGKMSTGMIAGIIGVAVLLVVLLAYFGGKDLLLGATGDANSASTAQLSGGSTAQPRQEKKVPEKKESEKVPEATPTHLPAATESDESAEEQEPAPVAELLSVPAAPAPRNSRSEVIVKSAAEAGPGTVISTGDLQTDVLEWVEAVTGEKRGDLELFDWLMDGQLLCRFINIIQPGTVKKINPEKEKPFKRMENVTAFIGACRTLGVQEKDLFTTVDLHEGKNLEAVKRCIYSLGNAVRTSVPSFLGPHIGIAQKSKATDDPRANKPKLQTLR